MSTMVTNFVSALVVHVFLAGRKRVTLNENAVQPQNRAFSSLNLSANPSRDI